MEMERKAGLGHQYTEKKFPGKAHDMSDAGIKSKEHVAQEAVIKGIRHLQGSSKEKLQC